MEEREFGLGELRPGQYPNSFATSTGIHINGNDVAILRQALPARARLRTRGAADPVVAVVNGQGVAVLMPLAPPRR